MSKVAAKTGTKPAAQQSKAPEKKVFRAEDYATVLIPV
jgi:hypothetical protein